MGKRKRATHSQAADQMVHRYIENQGPAPEDVQEEFTEAETVSALRRNHSLRQPLIGEEHEKLSAGDGNASLDMAIPVRKRWADLILCQIKTAWTN